MAKRFIFLEISDPQILSLITSIRESAMGAVSTSRVHVTVRGPYHREIPIRQLEYWQQLLAAHPLVLNGVGKFQAADTHVVYLKVQHPALRRIWWKPDYPIDTFGFNPHVTVYEGTNADRANRLKEFLTREGLKLLTWDFQVAAHVSDHRDLFKVHENADELFLGLVNRRLVRADILARLARTLGTSGTGAPTETGQLSATPAARRA